MAKEPSIALTHDYLMDFGGAEQVLLTLHEMYPKAPIFTSIVDKKGMGKFWNLFADATIYTSWFNSVPYAKRLISPLRFLLPVIWGSFDLGKYDVIIDSSSWAITKGFKTRNEQTEICYCHTPPRYLYGYDTSRNWKGKWFGGLISFYSLIVNTYMRKYDFSQAQKVDSMIANSRNTAGRILKFWKRDSVIIYPPIDVVLLQNSTIPKVKGEYFLTGGRLVSAKNFDLIIKACAKAGVALKIFGSGILEHELRSIADSSVEFLGKITNDELISYYKGAKGFIVAQQDEDFGMTLVEAQAVGCPIIAFKGGGYVETVVEGKTGIFFESLSVESLVKAIQSFGHTNFVPKTIQTHAKQFDKHIFKEKIEQLVKGIVH